MESCRETWIKERSPPGEPWGRDTVERTPETKSRGGRGGRDSHRESPRRVDIPPETAAGRRGGRRDHQRQSHKEGGWTCRNKEGHRAKRENPERVREKRTEGTRRLSGERAPWRRKGRKPEAGSDGHRETLNLTGKGEDRSAKTGERQGEGNGTISSTPRGGMRRDVNSKRRGAERERRREETGKKKERRRETRVRRQREKAHPEAPGAMEPDAPPRMGH